MSRRWMPTEPLPEKYRLSVPVTKDSHPDLHAWLSTLPQGDIAPRARELLMIGLRAVQMGISVPMSQTVPVAAAAPVALVSQTSQTVHQRTIPQAQTSVDGAPPETAAQPHPASAEVRSESVDIASQPARITPLQVGDGELNLLRELGASF